jgi:NADPH:quinone reductase-like Zn-dependent oxidoreductase
LIHGATVSVGLFAVQLAHRYGAYVIATTSGRTTEFVSQLGAGEVIDYATSRFEDHVENVEMVFDAVGGDTLDRSWAALKLGGRSFDVDWI